MQTNSSVNKIKMYSKERRKLMIKNLTNKFVIFISLNWEKNMLKNKSIKSFLVSKDNVKQGVNINEV